LRKYLRERTIRGMKETFTTSEAAEELGVSPARVRQMVRDGILTAEKFGRDLSITRKAIEAAKQRKTMPGPAPKNKALVKKSGKKAA
jgi:excisionase family DNA binding protein